MQNNESIPDPYLGSLEISPAMHGHSNAATSAQESTESSLASPSWFQIRPNSAEISRSTSSWGLVTPLSNNVSLNPSDSSLALLESSLDGITERLEAVVGSRNDWDWADSPQKKRKRLDEEELEDVRATRDASACTWCQLMKQKVLFCDSCTIKTDEAVRYSRWR